MAKSKILAEAQKARESAIFSGNKVYFSGKPCRRGHLSEKLASSGACRECTKLYLIENPEQAKINRQRSRDRYYRNPEVVKARFRQWRIENMDRVRELAREWARRNPEKTRANVHIRRSRKLEVGGTFRKADILKLFTAQKSRCYWCKGNIGRAYHIDHVWPLSKGGSNGPENIVLACPPCNRRKHASTPIEFAGRLL